MIAPMLPPSSSSVADGTISVHEMALERARTSARDSVSDGKTKEAALQFEQIMIRQMLEPMEKSLSQSFGGGSNSPMVGGMIMSSLSQSISDGGGLGLADVIEEALRSASPAPVSVGEMSATQSTRESAGEET